MFYWFCIQIYEINKHTCLPAGLQRLKTAEKAYATVQQLTHLSKETLQAANCQLANDFQQWGIGQTSSAAVLGDT